MIRPRGKQGVRYRGIFQFCGALLIGLTAGLGLPAAKAETLAQVLKRADGGAGRSAPCIFPTPAVAVPGERPHGPCSANIIAAIYLDLLRDRERLEIVRATITRQRDLLAAVQRQVEAGISRSGDSLLAEIEMKYWQRRETQLTSAVLHAEYFFSTVMDSEPSGFIRPDVPPSAWPADETVALMALAERETIPEKDQPAAQSALKHLWIDYEAARRDYDLLQPMQAFAADLARATGKQYEIGQVGTATLQERYRDATLLHDALVSAEYRLLTLQLDILERLGRRAAAE
ncbi:hypothetical protein [Pelagibius sp. 7325]|uniref:hypothetical protein n=1 Tax=Pelagibius sp. 7325 TaxID=3131994 RepID=UPI0030EEFA0A